MSKKTVVITGSSRGIGRACAILFAKNNYNVIINYNKSKKLAEDLFNDLKEAGYSVDIFKADISNRFEANSLINYCIGKFGKIDVLINNAGISQNKLFTDITDDDWNEMMGTNLNGIFYTTQKALQYMLPECSGKIINISSIWGMVGGSFEVHYSTSKAAIIGMTKALAKELGPSNIQVNCIAPGVIQTDMLNGIDDEIIEGLREETPLMRIGTVDDIANCALFLASDKSDFITGQVISPNGGFVI
ncbi:MULTISPECIES: elongation factor P 5-aminopentanone reductase [Romboutsia]|jgi:3-oxoacyl-[acyl-carrier protein] reductase|uniref:elongation factor P 5-aminopentanone reductase n=1 Tax=Romboutsia TaxID=1501226 RepID=UPI00216BA898|nr:MULTISPECIES: 3-oxoacyl-ACP reductase FabG [Romboutsia]MCI9062211.1 3-oxoacyl-ACP reductase FabG [Romboutsia sp.]